MPLTTARAGTADPAVARGGGGGGCGAAVAVNEADVDVVDAVVLLVAALGAASAGVPSVDGASPGRNSALSDTLDRRMARAGGHELG